jgi:hypothetical protein
VGCDESRMMSFGDKSCADFWWTDLVCFTLYLSLHVKEA